MSEQQDNNVPVSPAPTPAPIPVLPTPAKDATSAAVDAIANRVISALEKKNSAQKFDRPDGWLGVGVKIAATAAAGWAISKGMDAAYCKVNEALK
jgi:hypothetical protein